MKKRRCMPEMKHMLAISQGKNLARKPKHSTLEFALALSTQSTSLLPTSKHAMPRIVITAPGKTPQPYRFEASRSHITLGRGSDNDIPIDAPSVSTYHASLQKSPIGYELIDLGSTNGTKHNGLAIQKLPLAHGSTAVLGDVEFLFELSPEEQSAFPQLNDPPSPVYLEAQNPPPAAQPEPKEEEEEDTHGYDTLSSAKSGCGFTSLVIFVLLVLAAFAIGLNIRFKQETGKSLPDAVMKHFSEKQPAP